MGLAILILGLAVFFAPHLFTPFREARQGVIARLGERPYKGIYSLISLIGLILMAYGYARYRATGWIDLWYPPAWTRHATVALVWPSIICIAAAYFPGKIKTTLKHPMLAGIKLWSLAHLISNGDLGSILLFGSFLAYAVFDRITLKRRTDAGSPPIPVGGARNDMLAVIVGTVVYLLLGWLFHPYVVGVPAFAG